MKRVMHARGVVIAAAAAFAVPLAHGAGFALTEQGASGMGNAYAGAAAIADDASTVFFNPAGMARLNTANVVLAGHVVSLDIEFKDRGSQPPSGLPQTGGNGGKPGDTFIIPNLFAVIPLGERWRFGVGLSAPWGLKTEYDSNWIGRFQAQKTEVTSININPSLSFAVSERFSLGAGVNYTQLDAELTRQARLGAAGVGNARLVGSDYSVSWNAGALWQMTDTVRLGLAYRSDQKYDLNGAQTLYTQTGAAVPGQNFDINAALKLPAMMSLSGVWDFSEKWSLLGDATYTTWSDIQDFIVKNAATGNEATRLELKLRDSWRYSLALNYRMSDTFLWRVGTAFDQSPVRNAETRTANLPDADRYWLSIGFRWQAGPHSRLDFGYAHLFVRNATINHTLANQGATPGQVLGGRLVGDISTSVDIISASYTHSF